MLRQLIDWYRGIRILSARIELDGGALEQELNEIAFKAVGRRLGTDNTTDHATRIHTLINGTSYSAYVSLVVCTEEGNMVTVLMRAAALDERVPDIAFVLHPSSFGQMRPTDVVAVSRHPVDPLHLLSRLA